MKENKKVVHLHNDQKVAPSRAPDQQAAQTLFKQMLDGYEKYKTGTKRNTPKTVAADLRIIKQLAEHSGLYPWEWRLDDWDAWNTDLVARKGISVGTQRKNGGSIRNFLKYVSTREVFQREVKQQFNAEVTEFIDEDEILHHLYETEQKEPRPAFTEALSDQFFDALKAEIKLEASHPSRKLLNLQRDLAFFYPMKVTGLRVGSMIALNIDSFGPNPKAPEMGEYGAVYTIGKGSAGSGPRPISTWFDDPKIPQLLEWYIKEIRPQYLKPNNPDERALFLSERGTRLSYASIWDRLQKRLDDAGLKGRKLCNHSFRHGKASEGGVRYGTETTRRMLNHKYGSTTQGYMAIDDEYSQQQIADAIREQIDQKAKRDAKKANQSDNDKDGDRP
ncbi:MAG: tyrosine-type recombinase/integrase [Candidatus Thiodiazotropha endolucinida]|nr:tyrosine-type recombinase/integrase [Candidatus Thiodiazotropha taylori]MCW4249199.1 tyrosine-type recombinase/integrase [Candidatus Thiodiazotropha endolucinida]